MTVVVALYDSSLVCKHQCKYSERHVLTISEMIMEDILTDMLLKHAEFKAVYKPKHSAVSSKYSAQ